MYFDGVDDYVKVSNNPSLIIPYEITVIAWATYYPLNKYTNIIGKGTHDRGFAIQVSVTNDVLFTVNNDPAVVRWWIAGGNMSYLMTFYAGVSRQGYTAFYVNNSIVGTVSNSYPPYINNTYDLYVGRKGFYAPNGVFQGYISMAMVYSRALSDSEIRWNYLYPDNPVRNGLVLWLKADPSYVKDIDGDGVLEWIDLSGNNNHGKIYGAQLVQLVKTPARTLTPYRVSSPKRTLGVVR
jgi:hypothetical protein